MYHRERNASSPIFHVERCGKLASLENDPAAPSATSASLVILIQITWPTVGQAFQPDIFANPVRLESLTYSRGGFPMKRLTIAAFLVLVALATGFTQAGGEK